MITKNNLKTATWQKQQKKDKEYDKMIMQIANSKIVKTIRQ